VTEQTLIRKENQRRHRCGLEPLPTVAFLERMARTHGATLSRRCGRWIYRNWSDSYQAYVDTTLPAKYDDAPRRIALAVAMGL